VFEVPEGVGASHGRGLLEEEGVIRSAFAFRLAARGDERSNKIRPGVYELERGMSPMRSSRLSERPPAAETFRVTIPEGLTVDQTLDRLADAGPYTEEELERRAGRVALPEWVPELPEEADEFEGLLFPDTYEFTVDRGRRRGPRGSWRRPRTVLTRSTSRRATRSTRSSSSPRSSSARRGCARSSLVSSVIHNRLERPMRLEIDATVQYARGEHTDRVLFSDLEVAVAVEHLPQRRPAADADLGAGAPRSWPPPSPDDTDYLFYVVNDLETGAHAFADDARGAQPQRRGVPPHARRGAGRPTC
jgi:UPF0755 protein